MVLRFSYGLGYPRLKRLNHGTPFRRAGPAERHHLALGVDLRCRCAYGHLPERRRGVASAWHDSRGEKVDGGYNDYSIV